MEEHWIYVKTAAGEAARQQRKPLAHSDLRAVFRRVDGKTPVGALKQRFGDGNLVTSSLLELERLGLIEVQQEAPERAAKDTGHFGEGRPQSKWLSAWRGRLAAWQRQRQAKRDERAFLLAYETSTAEDAFAPVKLKPIRLRRGSLPQKNWLRRGAAVVTILLVCFLLLIVCFPYDRYRHEVELRLGLSLAETVSIGSIVFKFLPYPSLLLSGIEIGSNCRVKAIRVVPSPLSLFAEDWAIEQAAIEELNCQGPAIATSSRWFALPAAEAGGILLRRASLQLVNLELGGVRLAGMSGELQMSPVGQLEKIVLRHEVGGLRLEAQPRGTGYRLVLSGDSVKLPLAPDLVFNQLEAQGDVSATALQLDRLEAGLYGGSLEATAMVEWSQGGRMEVEASVKNTSLRRLAQAISPSFSLEAEMNGRFHLQASAADLSGLGDKLRYEGEFVARRGQIDRFDFMEALRGASSVRGGYTRFDRLSGSLRRDELGLHVAKLHLDAGILQASGAVDMDRSETLRGRFNLELNGPQLRVRALAAVGGKLAEPQLAIGRSERR